MDEKKILNALGYVMASSYRLSIIRYIGKGIRIPSDISNHIGVRTNHISNVLADLKKKDLVVCLNESAHKGRLYKNTELALGVLEYIDKME